MKPPTEQGKQEPNRLHTSQNLAWKHNTNTINTLPWLAQWFTIGIIKRWVKVGSSKRRYYNKIHNILPMHFASQGHHNINNILPLHFPLKAFKTNHLLLIHQNLLVPPKTTRFMSLMKPILHDNNKPSSWGHLSQLHCQAQLMPFTQGFSSLPRVSEAFTPINTFNIYIQTKKKEKKQARQNQEEIS